MRQSTIVGMAIGGATALSFGAIAGYQTMKRPSYAEVLNVAEVTQTVMTPEQSCTDVPVTHKKPVKDQHRIAGTLLGGLLGGVLGHQVGGGNGKTLTTVAGAAAGGYAGNQVQEKLQDKDTSTRMEHRCKTSNVRHDQVVGYDVKYTLNGQVATVRMDHRPGEHIPVKDGQLLLSEADTGTAQTTKN